MEIFDIQLQKIIASRTQKVYDNFTHTLVFFRELHYFLDIL